jgi:SAM-dependent methyltransferase
MVALGGAFGGVLVGIVAPLLLPARFELALCLVVAASLLAWQARRDARVYAILAGVAIVATIGAGVFRILDFYEGTIVATRNFYGVLRVLQNGDDDASRERTLMSGTIMHGVQYFSPRLRRRATSYYTTTSGIGRLLETLHPRMTPLRVGVIGLGTGTLAVYGTRGDLYRFYDINPQVVTIAKRDFTYIADSDAHVETPLGDARLTLEREPPADLDVLAVDAFSSDAIPVHLITQEALALYDKHLREGGVVAFHVTNRFLDLVPVVADIAKANGMEAVWIHDEGGDTFANRSDWVLVSRNGPLLASPRIASAATPIPDHADWRVWTDDFNNLFQVLRVN